MIESDERKIARLMEREPESIPSTPTTMTDAYPLAWPAGWPRTENPKRSAFQTPGGKAINNLLMQLNRMGATNIVISSNVMLRRDGLPYANQRRPEDSGVAVYFTLKGLQQCIPCDRWNSVDDNIHAIGLTVEALRGLERWGAKEMVDAAFQGFRALPAPSTESLSSGWWTVLGISPTASRSEIESAYRLLVKKHHPDMGGDPELFKRLNAAYQSGLDATA
jgi:hypothetical protein